LLEGHGESDVGPSESGAVREDNHGEQISPLIQTLVKAEIETGLETDGETGQAKVTDSESENTRSFSQSSTKSESVGPEALPQRPAHETITFVEPTVREGGVEDNLTLSEIHPAPVTKSEPETKNLQSVSPSSPSNASSEVPLISNTPRSSSEMPEVIKPSPTGTEAMHLPDMPNVKPDFPSMPSPNTLDQQPAPAELKDHAPRSQPVISTPVPDVMAAPKTSPIQQVAISPPVDLSPESTQAKPRVEARGSVPAKTEIADPQVNVAPPTPLELKGAQPVAKPQSPADRQVGPQPPTQEKLIVEHVRPAPQMDQGQMPPIRSDRSASGVNVRIGRVDLTVSTPAPENQPRRQRKARRIHGFDAFRRLRAYDGWEG
jgi:hypothetical protein